VYIGDYVYFTHGVVSVNIEACETVLVRWHHRGPASGPFVLTGVCGVGVSQALVTGSRLVLASTQSLVTVGVVLCTTLPLGESFAIPVLSKCVGACSSDDSRQFA
jgi:hypothetical protein